MSSIHSKVGFIRSSTLTSRAFMLTVLLHMGCGNTSASSPSSSEDDGTRDVGTDSSCESYTLNDSFFKDKEERKEICANFEDGMKYDLDDGNSKYAYFCQTTQIPESVCMGSRSHTLDRSGSQGTVHLDPKIRKVCVLLERKKEYLFCPGNTKNEIGIPVVRISDTFNYVWLSQSDFTKSEGK